MLTVIEGGRQTTGWHAIIRTVSSSLNIPEIGGQGAILDETRAWARALKECSNEDFSEVMARTVSIVRMYLATFPSREGGCFMSNDYDFEYDIKPYLEVFALSASSLGCEVG